MQPARPKITYTPEVGPAHCPLAKTGEYERRGRSHPGRRESHFATRTGGFSLLEALVAITISASICLYGVSSIGALREQHTLRSTLTKLKGTLERGRLSAMREHHPVRIELARTRYVVAGEYRDAPPPAEVLLPDTVTLVLGPHNPSIIRCHANGICTPATAILQNKRTQCEITVSLRGRSRSACHDR